MQTETTYTCQECKETLVRKACVASTHVLNPAPPPPGQRSDQFSIDIVNEISRHSVLDQCYSKPCLRGCNLRTRRVWVSTKIVETAPFFILRINRTCFDVNTNTPYKNSCTLKAPMELNLVSVMASTCFTKKCVFTLVGSVEHVGQVSTSGHYTADCRVRDSWWHFDDSTVTPLDNNEPSVCQAVMLMYRRL